MARVELLHLKLRGHDGERGVEAEYLILPSVASPETVDSVGWMVVAMRL
jgi:hypothetical protein